MGVSDGDLDVATARTELFTVLVAALAAIPRHLEARLWVEGSVGAIATGGLLMLLGWRMFVLKLLQ